MQQESKNIKAISTLAIVGSIIVYILFVAYSEFHLFLLVKNHLPAGAEIIGLLVVGVSAITSLALPIAHIFWVRDGAQRLVAYIFAGIHFIFIVANLVLDSSLMSGATINGDFATIYGVYIMPSIVALYAIGWLLLWELDPRIRAMEKRRAMSEELEDLDTQNAIQIYRAEHEALMEHSKSPQTMGYINDVARQKAATRVATLLGVNQAQQPPRQPQQSLPLPKTSAPNLNEESSSDVFVFPHPSAAPQNGKHP